MKYFAAALLPVLACGLLLVAVPDAASDPYKPKPSYQPAKPYAPSSDRPAGPYECRNCQPPMRYDSTEIVRRSKTIDHSRVINTYEVVYRRPIVVPPVVYVRPPMTVVNHVVHHHRITYAPHPTAVRVIYPKRSYWKRPHCRYNSYSGRCVLRPGG